MRPAKLGRDPRGSPLTAYREKTRRGDRRELASEVGLGRGGLGRARAVHAQEGPDEAGDEEVRRGRDPVHLEKHGERV